MYWNFPTLTNFKTIMTKFDNVTEWNGWKDEPPYIYTIHQWAKSRRDNLTLPLKACIIENKYEIKEN